MSHQWESLAAVRRSGLTRRSVLGMASTAAAGGLGALATAGCASPRGPREISILDDNTNLVFSEGLIDQFEKQTGIRVANYQMANFNGLHDRLATLFAARDDSVDVVMTWAGWSAEFGAAGWLEPLDESMLDGVTPSARDCVSWGGQLYGVPKFVSVQTMFYDKRAFAAVGLDPAKPPATWPEFVAAARKLSTGGRYGFACDMGNVDGAYQNFLRTLLLFGGTMYDGAGQPAFHSTAGIKALTALRDLYRRDKVMLPASLQLTNASDLATVFANRQVAMVFNWPFQWGEVKKNAAKMNPADVGIATLPGAAVPTASIDGSEGYAINRFSQRKAAAMEWLRFVKTEQVQRQIVTKEGWLPVNETLMKNPAAARALPVIPVYQRQSRYQVRRFGAPWYSKFTDELSANVTNVMLGQLEPAEALNTAARNGAAIISRVRGTR